MSFFTWEPEFDTGITVIDNQHRRIVDYINALDSAVKDKDASAVAEVIEQMIDYTVTHFTFEEELMAQHGYEHLPAHRKVHEAFTTRIQGYNQRLQAGEDVSRQLLSDLCIWLTNHIKRGGQGLRSELHQGGRGLAVQDPQPLFRQVAFLSRGKRAGAVTAPAFYWRTPSTDRNSSTWREAGPRS